MICNTMKQGQINTDRKIAHRGNLYQQPTSNGFVRKSNFGGGFITPNSLGARIIDADRTRLLTAYDIKILNERTPLMTMPPNQIEANKTLIPLGKLQESQSQFPFIASIPTNFVYRKEQEFIKEEQEEDMLKQTEKILDRIQQVQEQRALENPKVLEKGLFA